MKNFLDYASKKYHEGNPIIPDDVFDRLAETHGYEDVGHSVQHGVAHYFPMWSLKKCYVGEKPIVLVGDTIETPKLDGAAISLLYVEGQLVMALTRGNGKRGEDITDKIKLLVESFIPTYEPIIQIIGEIAAKKTIPNARNYAAGALNLKDIEEFKTREVTFIAYGLQVSENKSGCSETYVQDMQSLSNMGFNTVLDGEWNEYPQDGRVYRLNSNQAYDRAGYTSSHPRGAFALKVRPQGVSTTLKGVEWQVGRTGTVNPVAILEPVKVGDAMVSRATLHNMKYIEELGLEIGCEVEIIRSGEIIPRVVRRL
jgi:DNA ligase (NAD+)